MGSVYPLFKVTAGPDLTATVLHDFNTEDGNGPLRRMRVEEGFSISSPQLQGDPDSVFPQYGDRTITLPVQIWGPKSYALAKVAAASRWLMRDNCWLMVQLTESTKPVWFKLYRPQPGDLDFGYVKPKRSENRDVWRWSISLPAEPFAYGAKVSWGPVTVNNDPASGTNPCSYLLPAILGDAPAPLTVDIVPSVSWAECQPLISIARHDAGTTPTLQVWQTGGFTAGTDTTASTADAAYSGGSRSSITFATNANLVTRLSGGAPSSPPAGRYKVLCRMARSDTSTTFAVRLGQDWGLGATRYGDTKRMARATSATSGYACYVDLGEFTFPISSEGFTAAEVGAYPAPSIQLQVQRLSGSGSVYVDAFVLIPVSTVTTTTTGPSTTLISRFYNAEINSNRNGIWDADKERFRAMNFGLTLSGFEPQLRGVFPEVIPGAANMLHLHHQIDGDDPFFSPSTSENKDTLSATADLRLSYYPRWLYVGDGS